MQGQSAGLFLPLLFLTAVKVNSKLLGNKGLNVYDIELWHGMKSASNNNGVYRQLESNEFIQPNRRTFGSWEDILFCDILWDCDESSEEEEKSPSPSTQQPSPSPISPTPQILDQTVPELSKSTHPPLANNCPEIPEDYSRFQCNTHAYKFHEEQLSWIEAQRQCQKESAQLLVIENGLEYDSVMQLVKREMGGGFTAFHVGIRRKSIFSPWKTVHDDRLIFEKWASCNPSNAIDGESCGAFIFVPNGPEGLISGPCSLLYNYICEIKLPSHCT